MFSGVDVVGSFDRDQEGIGVTCSGVGGFGPAGANVTANWRAPGVAVSQIMAAMEALRIQVLVVSNEFQTSHLSQLQEEMVEVAQLISHERKQECVEQPVDVALPLVVLPIKAEIVMLRSSFHLKSTHPRVHRQAVRGYPGGAGCRA